MRVTCLVDNAVQPSTGFWGEHGLAYLVETAGRRILFDTGQSGAVLEHNLKLLGVDPVTIDAVAISHAHYDHTGGLSALLPQLRPGIPLAQTLNREFIAEEIVRTLVGSLGLILAVPLTSLVAGLVAQRHNSIASA